MGRLRIGHDSKTLQLLSFMITVACVFPFLRARDAGGARTAERQNCGHRGAVNMWPHSLHRTQSPASHVCRRIIARGSVSELAQRVHGGGEV